MKIYIILKNIPEIWMQIRNPNYQNVTTNKWMIRSKEKTWNKSTLQIYHLITLYYLQNNPGTKKLTKILRKLLVNV